MNEHKATPMEKLHDLFTQLDQDCGNSSAALTGQISQLLDSVEDAQNAVDNILGTASEENWIPISAEKDGSYLVFTLDTRDAVVCCADCLPHAHPN